MDTPLVSIVIPYYPMENATAFLIRCLKSIEEQTYRNFEVIITQDGKAAANTNSGIFKSKGDIIKFLHMDDFFYSPHSLSEIVEAFDIDTVWIATGCSHTRYGTDRENPHYPEWSERMIAGDNTIGAPSVIATRSRTTFDESLEWLFDCDYYQRMYMKYGKPKMLHKLNVVIGLHESQASHLLSEEKKREEHKLLLSRYA